MSFSSHYALMRHYIFCQFFAIMLFMRLFAIIDTIMPRCRHCCFRCCRRYWLYIFSLLDVTYVIEHMNTERRNVARYGRCQRHCRVILRHMLVAPALYLLRYAIYFSLIRLRLLPITAY